MEESSLPDLDVYDATEEASLAVEGEADVRRELRARSAEGANEESLLADEAIEEIEQRALFVGTSYPIEVDASVARLKVADWRDAPAYSFLVALNARYVWKLTANLQRGARLFERLVIPALRKYWCGDAMHFGWPREPAEHGAFRVALPRLLARMRERLSVHIDELPLDVKDLAVDAVAWGPRNDRHGNTVMLCQCSIGDDWAAKGVPIETWRTLVNFAVAPTRALCFPFVPEAIRPLNEVDWLLLCAGVGVPLDRLRLAHLLGSAEIEPDLLGNLRAWTETLEQRLALL